MTHPTPTRDEAPDVLAKQITAAASDMCEIARIAGEWRNGPKQSLTAIREIRAVLTSAPAPASGGVDAKTLRGIIARWETRREYLNTNPSAYDAFIAREIAGESEPPLARSALSPAATPVSEAEPVGRGDLIDGLDDLARRMPASADKLLLSEAIGLIQSLAKPASSPAGGDVDIEAHALKAQE